MNKLYAIGLLLLGLVPAFGAEGDGTGPILISYQNQTQLMNQSMIQAMVNEAVQTMNQTIFRINQTDVTISNGDLMVNATQAMKQIRISAQEMVVNGLQLINESISLSAQVMAQVSTINGTIVMNMVQEQNQLRIESLGVNTTIQLALNEHVRIEENQLILNKSGVERVLTVLPEQAMNQIRATNNTIRSMELVIEQEQAMYKINELRQARLFWFIPVGMEVNSKVSAENGTVISRATPWWSFLAVEVE